MANNEYPLMQCGHVAQGKLEDGKPICVICAGNPQAEMVDKDTPDLTGRTAFCSGCKYPVATRKPSSFELPFFQHRPDRKSDTFYCGCWGWD